MLASQLLTKCELFRDAFYFREGYINSSAWPDFDKTRILYLEQFLLADGENIKTEAVSV